MSGAAVPDQFAVSFRNAAFGYAGRSRVARLDLDIEAGSAVALIGPNGSGKSTLLRGLLGLAELTAGSVKVLGLADTGRDTARAAPPTTPTVATVLAAQVAPRRGKPSGRRRTAPGARRRPGMVWRDTRVEDLPRGVRIPSTVTGTSGKVTFW